METQEIQGLPTGATAVPIGGQQIEGLPPGATAVPMTMQSHPVDAQGRPMLHMTTPQGEHEFVSYADAGNKLQSGYRIGPPSQQKLGGAVTQEAVNRGPLPAGTYGYEGTKGLPANLQNKFDNPFEHIPHVAAEAGKDLLSAGKGIVHTVADPPSTPEEMGLAIGNPALAVGKRIASGMADTHKHEYDLAKQSAEQGDTAGSMVHSANAAIPFAGDLASGIYEEPDRDKAAGMAGSRIFQAATMHPEFSPAAVGAARDAASVVKEAPGAIAGVADSVRPSVGKAVTATGKAVKAVTHPGDTIIQAGKSMQQPRVGNARGLMAQSEVPTGGAKVPFEAAPVGEFNPASTTDTGTLMHPSEVPGPGASVPFEPAPVGQLHPGQTTETGTLMHPFEHSTGTAGFEAAPVGMFDESMVTPKEEPPSPSPVTAPFSTTDPLKAQSQILKNMGVAGPRATLKPMTSIPSGELVPSPEQSFSGINNGESAMRSQLAIDYGRSGLMQLRAIAEQRGIDVLPGDTNITLHQKIMDTATPQELQAFQQDALEKMQPDYSVKSQPFSTSPKAEPFSAQQEPTSDWNPDTIQAQIDANNAKRGTSPAVASPMGAEESGITQQKAPTEGGLTPEQLQGHLDRAKATSERLKASADRMQEYLNKYPQSQEQGGHAGGGVSSVEELNRPGINYVVSKGGNLTYHGKLFDPGSIPNGASHVTVLNDGTIRVNAGPKLTPAQENSIRAAMR